MKFNNPGLFTKTGSLAGLLLLSSYTQAWDEDREAYFTPRFAQSIKDRDYCTAMQIADQRLLNLQNPKQRMSRSQMDSRHLRWLKWLEDADAKCRASDWGKVAQQYQEEIQTLSQELTILQQLQQQFKVVLNASDISYGRQGNKRYVQLYIKNASQYPISAFVLDYRKFGYSTPVKVFNYPADMRLAGYPGQEQGQRFEAGTEQVIKVQTEYAPDLSGLFGGVGIPVKQLSVADELTPQVYNFGRIQTLEKRIFELQQNLEYRRFPATKTEP